MAKIFEELDYHQTAIGELTLRRKHIAMFGNLEVYEVKLGDSFLMSSMFHAVEDAVADLGLRELANTECDVIVGGLGLGYTALAALAHPNLRSLTIVEFLEPVIGWHRRGLVPLGNTLSTDDRCSYLQGDFFALAQSAAGFRDGQKYHAVLLDIDHSPRNLLHDQNAAFYSAAGLTALSTHLHPGGVFAMWSDDPPDDEFLQSLQAVFATARAEVVTFPNPILDSESASTVYIARKAPAAPDAGSAGLNQLRVPATSA
jgi:spermidine synthase